VVGSRQFHAGVLPVCNEFDRVLTGFRLIFAGFDKVSPGFCWLLLGFYWGFLGYFNEQQSRDLFPESSLALNDVIVFAAPI